MRGGGTRDVQFHEADWLSSMSSAFKELLNVARFFVLHHVNRSSSWDIEGKDENPVLRKTGSGDPLLRIAEIDRTGVQLFHYCQYFL